MAALGGHIECVDCTVRSDRVFSLDTINELALHYCSNTLFEQGNTAPPLVFVRDTNKEALMQATFNVTTIYIDGVGGYG